MNSMYTLYIHKLRDLGPVFINSFYIEGTHEGIVLTYFAGLERGRGAGRCTCFGFIQKATHGARVQPCFPVCQQQVSRSDGMVSLRRIHKLFEPGAPF